MLYLDLKRFRFEHNLTQNELGEIIGISPSSVSRMENQCLDVNTTQYGRLCDKFSNEIVDKYIIDKESSE